MIGVNIIIKNIEDAIKTIEKNYSGDSGCLLSELNDSSRFSIDMFWELYDSILLLVKEKYDENEITNKVSSCYQRLLKEFIYHLSSSDISNIENFPENYNGYIERMDYAVQAQYSKGNVTMKEDYFELQRSK